MQNSVYERKQNGEDFFSLPAVTYSRFGNCPANGLVTEQPQYSVAVCIFSTWHFKRLTFNLHPFAFSCIGYHFPPCKAYFRHDHHVSQWRAY